MSVTFIRVNLTIQQGSNDVLVYCSLENTGKPMPTFRPVRLKNEKGTCRVPAKPELVNIPERLPSSPDLYHEPSM